jgi:GT2 family glycosyltransferase
MPEPVTVVIPAWNGERWLPGLFESLAAQTLAPEEIIVVDNGSGDGTLDWLRREAPHVRVLAQGRNTGFAMAANRGLLAARTEFVALVNTDVVLAADWLELMAARLEAEPGCASVACKMVRLGDRSVLDDCGDVLRRDGVCEQRGHGWTDDGRWDEPGYVFGACAGAALYRRAAVREAGAFDERFFSYLEDVDLALRLQMGGWRCAYEPRAVAEHAGGGSAGELERSVGYWTARNTLLLVSKAWPAAWLDALFYRQAAWLLHAANEGRLREHARGLLAGLRVARHGFRERAVWRSRPVSIQDAVPRRPFRGPRAGGHRESGF